MPNCEHGLKFSIDTSSEKFGAAVTIAHLARFSFNGQNSDDMDIYFAAGLLERDWKFELVDYDYEYGMGVHAEFKDGSKLNVSAWRMAGEMR